MRAYPEIICRDCREPAAKTGPRQFYCKRCSGARDAARKAAHSNRRGKAYGAEAGSRIAERGRRISGAYVASPDFDVAVELLWSCTITVPFNWAGSKNHIFTGRVDGHADLRVEQNTYRGSLSNAIRAAIAGQTIAQNKLWIDLMVQKPSHRGDAANFVDMVCDAVQDATGLDDRWFSIRRVDWQIMKGSSCLILRIGQQSTEDVQACSACGRLLPFACFHANRGQKNGIGRQCRDCSAARSSRRSLVSTPG